uniref:Uncharacterized protein n=1 Tax=Clytia hemisphaerica TaxID=252671 RepID=A0A7M5VE24_9CNID
IKVKQIKKLNLHSRNLEMTSIQCYYRILHLVMISLLLLIPNHVFAISTHLNSKRSECFQNSDCPKMFICEIGRCIMISTEKQIIAKQTCSNLKSRCALDSDCSCAERSMVCINTECVYSDFHNRPMPVMCQQHSDCNIPYLCKGSTCKEAKSFEELMILTAAYDSCSGSDGCPQNHGCMQATHKCVALDVMPKAKFYKRNEECIYNSDCAKGLTCNGNICTKDLSLVSR